MSGYAANPNFTGVQPKRPRLSPQKIPTFPCIFNLQPGQELFTIGDVHGDLLAMLSALRLTGCVDIPDHVLQKVHICHEGELRSRIGFPLTPEEMASIQWRPGCRHVVAFLGDVLDNRRRLSKDIFGVCAMTGTQTQMLDLLYQLRMQALPQGGCVIFVLGNHDVANMTRDVDLGLLVDGCTNYAPRVHSRIRSNGQQREYVTCQTDENNRATEQFSQEHVQHMLEKIRHLSPVAVARVNFSNADPRSSVLLVHGGLDHRAFLPNVHPGKDVENLQFINRVYIDALFNHDEEAQNMLKDDIGPRAPTWCRPSFLGVTRGDQFLQSSPEELMTFFGAPSMIKAHDVQSQQQIRCTSTQSRAYSRPDGWEGRGVPSSDDTVMSPGDLCFIDVGMSRAFGPSRRYQVLRLYMDHQSGTLRRQVVK